MPFSSSFKLLIVQPAVPHYRKEFFNLLAKVVPESISLRAAPTIPGGPASIPADALAGVDYRADCSLRPLAGGRMFWQQGLSLQGMSAGDVLVLSGNPRFLSNFSLLWQARRRGIGVVWWGHGWSSTSSVFSAWLRRGLMRLADVLLLYTDVERERFIDVGFAPARVFATNNTMGNAEIEEAKKYWPMEQVQDFLRDRGLASRDVLLFCGRLTEKSGFHLLLEAFSALAESHPALSLVVVGDGEQLVPAQQRAVALGVAGRVIWVGELHEEKQLAPWFLSAKAMVYPGPIGLSLLHAFNYGLPVITHATDSHHGPEISALEDGTNGLLFAEGNVQALALTIKALLSNPVRRQAMAQAALQTVQDRFSTQRMVDGFVNAVNAAHSLTLQRKGQVGVRPL